MASSYGMIAILTTPEMTKEKINDSLQTAALMLDNEFGEEIEEEIEDFGEIIAARPPDSRWMTVCDPVSETGADGEIGLEIAQIYSVAFDAPCISLSVIDSEYLFVAISNPQREFSEWAMAANEEDLAGTEEFALSCTEIPTELLKLLPEELIFLCHRLWKQHFDFAEDRLEELANMLSIAVIGLREDFDDHDWPGHEIWRFDFRNF